MSMHPLSAAEWAHAQSARHANQSGLELLIHGLEAYAHRVLLAEQAERTLDIQTYIIEDGHSTRRLMLAMLAAAQRGVKVRLLIDDLSVGHQQVRLARLNAHPNIEIRLFNPIRWGRRYTLTRLLSLGLNVRRLQRRMHNKLWIADGAFGIWGGRNLSDFYFSANTPSSFIDVDVLAVGGATVAELAEGFNHYWYHQLAVPLNEFVQADPDAWQALADDLHHQCARDANEGAYFDEGTDDLRNDSRSDLLARLTWAPTRVVYDHPDKAWVKGAPGAALRMAPAVAEELARATRKVSVAAGYFIPHRLAEIDFTALLARKVRLTVVTNALESSDVPLVHGSYARWRRFLLRRGARMHEIRHQPRSHSRLSERLRARTRLKLSRPRSSSLHAKVFTFDDERLMVGSFNCDPRSVWWNCEMGVFIDSAALNKEMQRVIAISTLPEFSYQLQCWGRRIRWSSMSRHARIRHYYWERGSLWRRFQAMLARLLGLERWL